MEQGEIVGWSDTDKIYRVRSVHTKRHIPQTSLNGTDEKNNAKVLPCVFLNIYSYIWKSTHETKGVLYKHVYAMHLSKDDKAFSNTQSDCRKYPPKNE